MLLQRAVQSQASSREKCRLRSASARSQASWESPLPSLTLKWISLSLTYRRVLSLTQVTKWSRLASKSQWSAYLSLLSAGIVGMSTSCSHSECLCMRMCAHAPLCVEVRAHLYRHSSLLLPFHHLEILTQVTGHALCSPLFSEPSHRPCYTISTFKMAVVIIYGVGRL